MWWSGGINRRPVQRLRRYFIVLCPGGKNEWIYRRAKRNLVRKTIIRWGMKDRLGDICPLCPGADGGTGLIRSYIRYRTQLDGSIISTPMLSLSAIFWLRGLSEDDGAWHFEDNSRAPDYVHIQLTPQLPGVSNICDTHLVGFVTMRCHRTTRRLLAYLRRYTSHRTSQSWVGGLIAMSMLGSYRIEYIYCTLSNFYWTNCRLCGRFFGWLYREKILVWKVDWWYWKMEDRRVHDSGNNVVKICSPPFDFGVHSCSSWNVTSRLVLPV